VFGLLSDRSRSQTVLFETALIHVDLLFSHRRLEVVACQLGRVAGSGTCGLRFMTSMNAFVCFCASPVVGAKHVRNLLYRDFYDYA
jgi:hypothetical protein